MRQLKTGYKLGEESPEYTCSIYNSIEDLPAFSDMEALESKGEVDYFCIEKTGHIKFIHLAGLESLSFIKANGLIPMSDYIPDLGVGIYCIEDSETNIDALDNLKGLHDCYEPTSRYLEVRGEYNGKYIECIYGNSHEGFIVLLDVSDIKITSVAEKSLAEIFEKLYNFS